MNGGYYAGYGFSDIQSTINLAFPHSRDLYSKTHFLLGEPALLQGYNPHSLNANAQFLIVSQSRARVMLSLSRDIKPEKVSV